MDPAELRVRQTEMRLEQLRHQVGLRHSDLQRRFILALTLTGGVFLSLVRAEVPAWGATAAVPPLAWAALEMLRIRQMGTNAQRAGEALIGELDEMATPAEGSGSEEANDP